MNFKRLAAFASLAALIGTAVPAYATTQTGTITVKWNTQAVAQLTLHTDYTNAGAKNAAAASIVTNANGGSGTCTATDPTNTDLTVDFGNVSPDFTKYTDCEELNGMVAAVATNSTNWSLGENATACSGTSACTGNSPVASFSVCAYSNNTGQVFPVAAGNVPSGATAAPLTTRTAPAAVTANGVCPAGTTAALGGVGAGTLISGSAALTTNLVNGYATSFTSAAPGFVGQDVELVIANNAPAVAPVVTETITLTAN